MKKIILLQLSLLIPTVWAQKQKDQDIEKQLAILKNQHSLLWQEVQTIRKEQEVITKQQKAIQSGKKEKTLLEKAFVKFIANLWDVMIVHLKRWYTALIVIIILWYKSTLPFPWRKKIS